MFFKGITSYEYIIFALSLVFIAHFIKEAIGRRRKAIDQTLAEIEHSALEFEKKLLEANEANRNYEERVQKNMKLYEFTKELSEFLDENKVIATFEDSLPKYISCENCRYQERIDSETQSQQCEIVSLSSSNENFGYVVAQGLKEDDRSLFEILIAQLVSNIKRARLYRRVQELAISDSLTKVFTRVYTLSRFDEELRRSAELNLSLSFLMIDIDNFKELNDKFGHLVGDVVLRNVAEIIKQNSREIDLIGRFGGEEFMVVLPMTNKEGAMMVAERIRKSVEATLIKAFDELLSVTISVGVSNFPEDAKTAQDLADRADWALYRSKRTGKNKISAFGHYG